MDPQTLARRSAREVLEDHLDLARRWDFETDLERNFDPDIVLMTTYGIFRGVEGLRQKVRLLQEQLPEGVWTYHSIMVERHLGFLEWSGVGENGARVEDGADSYLIEEGKIRAMTIHYTVIPDRPPES
ncbi:nuclear transport factor 2 family protein [Bradymonadaceae bacterium TMQ3]|uniref:Nuclear transport factor 2 family protein n=1 Tax=Lujinxingia sediminis TaxID=2480984 RepID=A0ABY0CP98_9DELT|nr:nuclear transport factor 2 family protein [Lujinxingia sediminis]RDV36450.1 nuclear transport factor 2 family protein [Bradymonadaceae bacterium TMQ3]RVU41438.1 nuclear transport factor 2 family protein [Lujinxingia sediminis]TXC74503.1 nuclear transport factor 2 family protein [Bradymonadales bacterium TMQ1]